MPFFFFVAGVFANPGMRLLRYVIKHAKRLLIPYFLVFCLGILFTFMTSVPHTIAWNDVVRQFIYARPIELHVGPIWFLMVLFHVTILFFFYYRLFLSKNHFFVTFMSLGLLSIVAFVFPMIENKFGFILPLRLDSAFMALLFYSMGYLMKDYTKDPNSFASAKLTFFLFVMSLAAIILFPYFYIGQTYLSGAIYGPDLFFYIFTAFSGIVFMLILGYYLKKSSALAYIGRNSLIIFSVHTFATYVFKNIFNHFRIENEYLKAIVITGLSLLTMIGVSLLYNHIIAISLNNKGKRDSLEDKQIRYH